MERRKSKTTAVMLRRQEREATAFEMRKRGATYTQIGKALGIPHDMAFDIVMRALERLSRQVAEDADAVRAIELQRLDALIFAVWPEAQKGTIRAVDAMVRIMERRAKMLGLDAPTKLVLTEDEMIKYQAFQQKIKYDLDMRGSYEMFLTRVKDGSTEDLVSVLDNMMKVLAEMGQEENEKQKLLESQTIDVGKVKH
jgi:hypothetical protein